MTWSRITPARPRSVSYSIDSDGSSFDWPLVWILFHRCAQCFVGMMLPMTESHMKLIEYSWMSQSHSCSFWYPVYQKVYIYYIHIYIYRNVYVYPMFIKPIERVSASHENQNHHRDPVLGRSWKLVLTGAGVSVFLSQGPPDMQNNNPVHGHLVSIVVFWSIQHI